MQCPRCSSENDETSKFCWSCGATLHKVSAAPPTVVYCPFCKHENASNANFCVACGKNLWHQATAARVAAAAAASAQSSTPTDNVAAAGVGGAAGYTASAPRPDVSKPAIGPTARQPASAASFENAYKPSPSPRAKASRFELAAVLIVLLAVIGGALLWWSHQKEANMAEMAMSKAVPSPTIAKPEAPIPTSVALTSTKQISSTAVPAPPTPPGTVQATAAVSPNVAVQPVTERSATADRFAKRNGTTRQQNAPAVIAEPQKQGATNDVAAEAPARPPEPRLPTTREKVAACKQLSLFQKERCMWGVCDGKWGKEGCPSYDR
jgi:hypothetical protein